MIAVIIPIIFSGWDGSNQQTVDLPDHIKDLENVTVYPTDIQPANDINLEREMSFGSTDEVLIGRIGDLAVDDSGRVFIADVQQKTIYIFGPDGQFLQNIGGRGWGPGKSIQKSQRKKQVPNRWFGIRWIEQPQIFTDRHR